MLDRIGSGSSGLARAAIEAALKRQTEASQKLSSGLEGAAGSTKSSEFGQALLQGLRSVDSEVKRADALTGDMVAGRVTDLSAVMAQLKQSDLSLKFALEVRNKFIDAYREVMRMSV